MSNTSPVCLTIAGSDCSGGAGIQADLKTWSRLKVFGASVVTAVVAESAKRVVRIDPMPVASVSEQMNVVLEDMPVATIKSGMFGSAKILQAVIECWRAQKRKPSLVVDPVLVATTGDPLHSGGPFIRLMNDWLSCASLVTPNVSEAQTLLKTGELKPEELALRAVEAWEVPVLITGGDQSGDQIIDYYADEWGLQCLKSGRLPGGPFHGSGCTLSAAITAYLALDHDLPDAIRLGRIFVRKTMKHALRLKRKSYLDHTR